jgi:hypothetical protein
MISPIVYPAIHFVPRTFQAKSTAFRCEAISVGATVAACVQKSIVYTVCLGLRRWPPAQDNNEKMKPGSAGALLEWHGNAY